jgi:ribonuclease R
VVSRWFGKTLIHSDRRFTYEEAQERLISGEGDFAGELKILNRIAKQLRKRRFEQGSIDFDADEVRFRLDENGVPIEVFIKERVDAHMLVEDSMLLANRETATYIYKKGQGHEIPFVYRIHDTPDPARVAELVAFAKEMGFDMNIKSPKDIAPAFNRLAEESKHEPGLRLLEPLAIRTMAKAAYSSDNIGHYGLGFGHYTHFTSPIRRYSDVLTHRILFENLGEATVRVGKALLEERCKHISMQERKAMDAERESIKYKQVEFMGKHVGEVFEGRVSGIIDRGIFVELVESKCEGLVGFDTMPEPFDVEESRLRAKGLRSKRVIKMGDLVQVLIIGADLGRRQIEMELVE